MTSLPIPVNLPTVRTIALWYMTGAMDLQASLIVLNRQGRTVSPELVKQFQAMTAGFGLLPYRPATQWFLLLIAS